MTQAELGAAIGYSRQMVNYIEQGKVRLTVDVLAAVAGALGVEFGISLAGRALPRQEVNA